MILQQLSPENVKQAWPLISSYVEQLADRYPDDWPLDRIMEAMDNRIIVPWVIWEETKKECYGLGLTEIQIRASERKVMVIHAVGRDHKEWVHLISELEEYGAEQGVDKVEIIGRRGWDRSLNGYDRHQLALFTKELSSHGTA